MQNRNIFHSFLWQYGERLVVQGISFFVTLLLARLLLPNEYGVVSIATIFIALLEVFVTSGLGNALVQKKNVASIDFSTVFYFNIGLSCILIFLVIIIAPYIGSFYNNSILTPVLQLMSIRIFIASFNTVQQAYVQKNMLFKRLFYSSLSGTVISAVLGVFAAYSGLGVYALVIQYLSNALVNTLVLFFTIKWKPTFEFSYSSLKSLLNYGWKLLCSGLLNTLFTELKGFVIGGRYTPADLAYYDRGRQFPSLLYDNINTSIGKVLFPLLANVQDDRIRILGMTRLAMQILTFILVPLLMILYAVGDSIIVLLLTEKWIDALPFMRVTCITFTIVIINTVLTNAINALGRSDYHFKVELINVISGVFVLLLLMDFGAVYIALSVTISNLLCGSVRLYFAKKLFNYSFNYFLCDYLKSYLIAVVSLLFMLAIEVYITDMILNLFLVPFLGILLYIFLSYIFNKHIFVLFKHLCISILRRK